MKCGSEAIRISCQGQAINERTCQRSWRLQWLRARRRFSVTDRVLPVSSVVHANTSLNNLLWQCIMRLTWTLIQQNDCCHCSSASSSTTAKALLQIITCFHPSLCCFKHPPFAHALAVLLKVRGVDHCHLM